MLIDTHAHLYWKDYETDLNAVLQRCLENGVTTIINVGVSLETSKKSVEQAQVIDEPQVYSSIGIHPHEGAILTTDESIHSNLEELGKLHSPDNKIIAIGEIGLDFYFREDPDFDISSLSIEQQKENQRKLYLAQIGLAKKLGLPLIIHCRDGWSEIFVLELQGTKGVFHTFSGSLEDAQKALDLGYYLSFSCIITYPKNERLRHLIKDLPLDKILSETDSPFLPPQQIRGQRNEPAYVKEVVRVIAEIKGLSFEKAAASILENAARLFNLPL